MEYFFILLVKNRLPFFGIVIPLIFTGRENTILRDIMIALKLRRNILIVTIL
jgi:hypothetical protein